jgi:XTP/dITP diphosphohydrolase
MEEIRAMLGAEWLVEDLSAYPELISPEETGHTFSENAQIKALAASQALPGMLVLSDDSGLEVDILDGAPGVISARYSGEGATDASNRAKLKTELTALAGEGRELPFTGRFHCCMALTRDRDVLGIFDGAVEGTLLLEEEGMGGFGYDSLFVPNGYDHSFGVLPAEVKNQLSHRSRALTKLVEFLKVSL